MKELSFEKMEQLEGGNAALACAGGVAVTTVAVAATILTGGMFGFASVLSMSWTAANCVIAAGNVPR